MTEIIVSNNSYTVIANSANLAVIAAGSQGPQGIRGPIGITGGHGIELVAGINLGGNRVVTGAAEYADCTDLETIGRAIGITTGAANTGLPVTIAASGELDGFTGLTLNEPVYLSTVGTTTQTVPTSGYMQKLGVAISTTKLLINIQEPLAL
jgi:hypothetical protein